MDSSRVLVAVILSIVLIVAYQELVLKRFYPPPTQQQIEQAKAAKQAQAKALGLGNAASASASPISSPAAPGAAPTSRAQTPSLTAANPGGPERTVKVDSDYYVAVFTSRGARLKSFKLKGYKQTADKNSPPYEMVQVSPGGHLPLGAVMTRDGQVIDDYELDYATTAPELIELAPGRDSTLAFAAKTADGATITKTFTFRRSSYVYGMDVSVTDGKAKLEQLG